MASPTDQLETQLNELFVKNGPELPKGFKDFLVQYVPYLSLLGGIFSLWSAWGIWHWANTASRYIDTVNQWGAAFGVDPVSTSRWSAALWASLIIIAIMGVLYILAFSPLKNRKKAGWNLLFYALLLNVLYGIVGIFINNYGGGFGGFIGTVIGFIIGGYLLFQIRDAYLGKKPAAKPTKTKDSSDS